ncbi:DUF5009 domain-containing protein [Robiginitalea sp. M366]|uniref:acyltransferase family protein n=1 Tax=Robiginitalea aestuariiviva TaxID=3036903 RepID=UPI00240E4365|nr:heparan-alpha-glucosaminide N-acetyltransferase domain-containing protein [Robiginitalea aestuariiviva]MDG1573436.1 DUF5009 domain-containing protein [Robiginitalea aestuariiviva]
MPTPASLPARMRSIDFFRGLTMLLLIGEFSGLFEWLARPPLDESWFHPLVEQFHHHPWHGLRFWDLIQPYFMFIVGVSLALSVANRQKRGQTRAQLSRHVARRSVLLLLLGWGLYCIADGAITWRFQNVLAQLAVTYPLAYLVMRKPFRFQAGFSLAVLVLAEVLYRYFPLEGFDQPFTPGHNLGEWLELQLNGNLPGGHWVSLNALSTTAHTVWGVLAGQLLLGSRPAGEKLKYLLGFGLGLLVAGYALDPLTPIIKRIATSTFVLASGGWTLLTLAACFWWIDVKGRSRAVWFFAVVGMNPLFIYLFAHLGGGGFLENILHPFTYALMGWAGEPAAAIFTALCVWAGLWGICYWLYRREIFIRI